MYSDYYGISNTKTNIHAKISLEVGRYYKLKYKIPPATVERLVFVTDCDDENWYFNINQILLNIKIPKKDVIKIL